jgi:hypothetical protein
MSLAKIFERPEELREVEEFLSRTSTWRERNR